MRIRLVVLSALLLTACSNSQFPKGFLPVWTSVKVAVNADDAIPTQKLELINQKNGEKIFEAQCAGIVNTVVIDGTMNSIQCWWAGGGDQYALFDLKGSYVIRHRTVDEESGFGRWEDLKKFH